MNRDPSASPSGRYQITFYSREVFNTHWVDHPTLVDTQTGETLLAFKDQNWSVDQVEWRSDSVLVMELRKYPGNHEPGGVMVTVDCSAGSAAVGDKPARPLAVLEQDLEAALTWKFAPPDSERQPDTLLDRLRRFLDRL